MHDIELKDCVSLQSPTSDNKKRIVLLKSHLAKLGGAEKYTLKLADAFRDKNCEVTILTSGKPSPPPKGIRVLRLEDVSKLSFRHLLQFDAWCNQMVKALCPYAVLGLDKNRSQTHIRASNGVHAAFLKHREEEEGFLKKATFRINPLHKTLLALEKSGFENKSLKKLFTNSYMVKREILNFYKVDPQKIEVVHNGVEWNEMQNDFDEWKDIKPPSDVFQFLFIGHNYRRKGLELLLNGLSILKNRNFHLSVVGREKKTKHFMNLSKHLGLSEKVTFFGARVDTRKFYQLADCLVIPSFYDPFANVTVEALAMGLFVVSSNSNGGHEILDPSNGIVIKDLKDKVSMASALNSAMDHPKTLESALRIRNSIQHLDFSKQLTQFVDSII